MTALEPMIAAFALAVDADTIDIEDMKEDFGALLSGKGKSKAISGERR